MSVGLSASSVAMYSFQRYRAIVRAFQFRVSSPPTWRVTVATICGVWIVAALIAVPSALSNYQCEKGKILINYYQHVVIFELLASCVFPLCVVAFCYIMINRHLVESSRSISEGTQNPQLKTRRNTAKIVMGFAFVFMISYVPYHIYWTYFIYRQKLFLGKIN
jgi:Ca2+/Na+ antiporter